MLPDDDDDDWQWDTMLDPMLVRSDSPLDRLLDEQRALMLELL